MGSLIEEEVTLEIDGMYFVGFANVCPFEISVGKQYLVDVELTILDEFIIEQLYTEQKEIEQIDDGFAYFIKGILDVDKGTIDVGIIFEVDREFLSDYGYLHNQFVQIKVDRISVEFIS